MRRLVLVSVAIAITIVCAGVAARAVMLRGHVLPGVSVSNVDVGSLGRMEAQQRLARMLPARLDRPLSVGVGEQRFSIRGSALFELDTPASVQAAFDAGRRSFFGRLGAEVAPFLVKHDTRAVLRVRAEGRDELVRRLAQRTIRPTDAVVRMRGLTPVVKPAVAGTTVDVDALLRALADAVLGDASRVSARVVRAEPAVTTAEAEQAAEQAKSIVSSPVRVIVRATRVGALEPRRLAALLRFRPEDGRYALALESDGLARALRPLVRSRMRKPRDATFRVIGKRVRVVHARNGTQLAVGATQEAVLAAASRSYGRVARLRLTVRPAAFTTRDARALGIRRQLATYTTLMGESSANRIHNVHLMADYIDGTIIKAGKTFSFNKVVGPRTVERGFLEGQMIVGSLLLPAIGGGVCQTATTLFNDAFETGLPIIERHNHSWYLSHYPLGRDATVSWGGPDLVFKNDLRHAILIKRSYTDSTLTFTFYGTPQGRRVVAKTGPESGFRAPTMSYAVDPTAPHGSVKVVQATNEQGFDVTVYRTVYEHGRVLRRDSFRSSYIPVGPTTVYGPGRKPPGPYFVLPTT